MSSVTHALKRLAWAMVQDALIMANASRSNDGQPRVYYGGAQSGYAGGPQVKIGLLRKAFPNVVHGFNLAYLLSGALYVSGRGLNRLADRNIPIVLNQNGVYFPAWYPNGWEKKNEELAKALAAANHVFYQSAFCQRAAERFLQVKAKSSEILYNGVDTSVFTPAKNRVALDRRPIRLLLTGKIGPSTQSRLFSTIEGVAEARRRGANVVLDVHGMIEKEIMTRALSYISLSGLEGGVVFRGPYVRAQAAEVYRSADVYIMNNHNDSCPNVVLEALSCGLPVLYASSGGVPELVGDNAGCGMEIEESFETKTFPTGSQFVRGLEKIVQNYEAMSVQARSRACSMFDIHHWYRRHEEVFSSLLRKKQ